MNKLVAQQKSHTFQLHGDVRLDEYYWLKDKSNPEVIAYLEQENNYYDEVMKPLESLTTELYEAMVARIPSSEIQIPVQRGPYFYYYRLEKEKQYPIYARKRASNRSEFVSSDEEITLDENVLANGDVFSIPVYQSRVPSGKSFKAFALYIARSASLISSSKFAFSTSAVQYHPILAETLMIC